MKFKQNESMLDRGIRVTAGIILGVFGWMNGIPWMLVVSGVLIATGLIGFCGLYTLLGYSSCPMKK